MRLARALRLGLSVATSSLCLRFRLFLFGRWCIHNKHLVAIPPPLLTPSLTKLMFTKLLEVLVVAREREREREGSQRLMLTQQTCPQFAKQASPEGAQRARAFALSQ